METSLLEVMGSDEWKGFRRPVGKRRPAGWNKSLLEARKLINNERGESQRIWEARMEEAMGTSDFPLLFSDILDREVLAKYRSRKSEMKRICRIGRGNDFRTRQRNQFAGIAGRLQKVSEHGEYQKRKKSQTQYTYAVEKWGARVPFSWEAWLGDDLGALSDIAGDLADAARSTEDYFVTTLFWDADGPLDAYFNASVGQGGVSNLPLTIANLGTALNQMMGVTTTYDFDEVPIANRPRYLVVGPALQITAQEILKTTQKAWTDGTGSGATAHESVSILGSMGLELIVDPWIPRVVTTGTIASTTWALFSDSVKPAEFGVLSGHENPEIFLRAPGGMPLGGGGSPFDGSFDVDEIEYKVRHVFGGTRLDPRGGWASDGQ